MLAQVTRDLYMSASLRALWLGTRPPRPVLRLVGAADRAPTPGGWCGSCCRDGRVGESELGDLAAGLYGLRAAFSHDTDQNCCEACAAFEDMQWPLHFDRYSYDRDDSMTDFAFAGWRLPLWAGGSPT